VRDFHNVRSAVMEAIELKMIREYFDFNWRGRAPREAEGAPISFPDARDGAMVSSENYELAGVLNRAPLERLVHGLQDQSIYLRFDSQPVGHFSNSGISALGLGRVETPLQDIG
jgi:hypothetical protein